MQALRYKPAALFRLDDTTPFQDYSGYGRSGVVSGTERHGIALCSGAAYSQAFGRDRVGTFDSPAYVAGKEREPFSLGATIYPVHPNSGQVAQTYRENLATTHAVVGLGTVTNFSTSYSWAGKTWNRATVGAVNNGMRNNVPLVDLVPDQLYTIAVTFGNPNAGNISVVMDWCDTTSSAIVALAPNEIKVVTFTASRASYTSTFRFLDMVATSTGVDLLTADILITPQTSTTFFNGNTPGCEWVGAANASKSRTRIDVSRVNLSGNPSGESALGWLSNNSGIYPVTWDTNIKRSGARSAKATAAASNSVLASLYSVGANTSSPIPCVPGETFTFSVYVNPGQAGYKALAIMYLYDSAGANGTTMAGSYFDTPANTWTKVYVTVTVPAGKFNYRTGLNVVANTGVSTVGHFANFDDALLEKSSSSGTYFTGNSNGAVWAGTTDNSNSYMYISDGAVQILGNTGKYDGLTIDGTTVSFSTKYLTTGEAKCSYYLGSYRKADIFGVHNHNKNSLYVDGVLVDEVDISAAQQADTFDSPDSNLYSGQSAGGQSILANNIAIYTSELNRDSILSIYNDNNRVSDVVVSKSYGGERISVSSEIRHPYFDTVWSSDWATGEFTNTHVDEDQLVPDKVADLTVGGIWKTPVNILVGETASAINAVSITWAGENVGVEASINGTDWVAVTKDDLISIIPAGFTPTNLGLFLRVTFTAGQTTGYIENLRVRGYLTDSVTIPDNRTITYTRPIVTQDEYPVHELREDWGTKINGGTLEIGINTSASAETTKTVEVWMRVLDYSDVIMSSNISTGATNYVNGYAGNTLPVGEWIVRHYVNASGITGPFTFSGNVQIGMVATYPTALTATEVESVYKSYLGTTKSTIADTSAVAIAEIAAPVVVYAHDWQIISA